ncbi:hypothetical protein EGW08_001208 [Elysia chlorotica]|uniref:Chitin-binding type-2 domain-containing protein n=1 Tax=Elysia chlorotica TaxID=188477 RepID=A0A3S1BL99_ELYCH|nr:hypothetical protein EGW08_001208 [Elysia chlorotica]
MTHTPVSQSEPGAQQRTTLVTLERTEPYSTATVYSYRVRPTYDMTATKIRLSATIRDIACADYGVIECSVESRAYPRTSSVGVLSITSPPSKPVLVAPLDVLENREVTPAITCSTDDVGYPHWSLALKAVLPSAETPILIPTEKRRFSNGKRCSHGETLTLKGYLPVLAANGTILVCELLSPKPVDLNPYRIHLENPGQSDPVGSRSNSKPSEEPGDRDALTDEQLLMVIRDTICHNKGKKPSLIRHPYLCTRYIVCEEQIATIMACPPEQCFDPNSGNCGVEAVFLEPIHGTLGDGLAGLACSVIHVRDWTRMRIRRHSWGAFYDDVVEVNSEGQVTWHDDSLRKRALTDFRSSASPQLAELYVWIYELECGDEDSYKCEVDREEEESMTGGHLLKVYARASPPVLAVPTTAVEGQGREPVEIKCEATLGRPRGTLTLKRKLQREDEFRPVAFSLTTMQDVGACLIRQKSSFTIPKEEVFAHNSSQWVCEVRPSEGTLDYLSEAASSGHQELYIVPDDICIGQFQELLPHPVYGCKHFLHCGDAETSVRTCRPGTCFNAITHWCDIPAIGKPGQCEMTSGYLPHETACNKYINCAGGELTIERCPDGAVYASDGQCTTDIHEAFCSKQIYGARSRS